MEAVMSWSSKTEQFERSEMSRIERQSAEELIPMLLNSDPLVVLRVLAEIMLNGDLKKLRVLLANDAVHASWQTYDSDAWADDHDRKYAAQLTEHRAALQL
jgi:hypothetical protein